MKLSQFMLLSSVVLSLLGGYADMTGNRVFGLSRQHYWTDATYICVLAIGIHLLWHK
jgi:hypothetical protein